MFTYIILTLIDQFSQISQFIDQNLFNHIKSNSYITIHLRHSFWNVADWFLLDNFINVINWKFLNKIHIRFPTIHCLLKYYITNLLISIRREDKFLSHKFIFLLVSFWNFGQQINWVRYSNNCRVCVIFKNTSQKVDKFTRGLRLTQVINFINDDQLMFLCLFQMNLNFVSKSLKIKSINFSSYLFKWLCFIIRKSLPDFQH